MTPQGRKTALLAGGVAVAAALALLYGLVDPASHFFPRCIFLQLTGLECPGCGSQRAVHCLLSGDIAGAWRYNAMLVAALPFVILMLVAAFFRLRWPRLYNTLNSRVSILAWGILLVGWGVLRNIFHW